MDDAKKVLKDITSQGWKLHANNQPPVFNKAVAEKRYNELKNKLQNEVFEKSLVDYMKDFDTQLNDYSVVHKINVAKFDNLDIIPPDIEYLPSSMWTILESALKDYYKKFKEHWVSELSNIQTTQAINDAGEAIYNTTKTAFDLVKYLPYAAIVGGLFFAYSVLKK
jgi:hypothetical protein